MLDVSFIRGMSLGLYYLEVEDDPDITLITTLDLLFIRFIYLTLK